MLGLSPNRLATQPFLIVVFGMLVSSQEAAAEDLLFGFNSNGLTGLSTAEIPLQESQLSVSALPLGTVFNEVDNSGLGIDSRSLSSDGDITKLNRIGGVNSPDFEAMTFSFSRSGVLESINLDGLKDETLEYFSLELPNGVALSLFDFEVELRLNQQGFQLSDLGVPNPTLADGSRDDFVGLDIPFLAGEIFTLTYREIDYDNAVLPGYRPEDDFGRPTGDLPNGARLQGLGFTTVPEPHACWLILGLALSSIVFRSSE
ncbi:MAG: hypothetical protein RH917_07345 [Lacipirellulaceae bacterium]